MERRGDEVDGTVSEQVNTGQYCSFVICDYRKVHELYDTSNTHSAIKKQTRRENWLKSCFYGVGGGGEGIGEIMCLFGYMCLYKSRSFRTCSLFIFYKLFGVLLLVEQSRLITDNAKTFKESKEHLEIFRNSTSRNGLNGS